MGKVLTKGGKRVVRPVSKKSHHKKNGRQWGLSKRGLGVSAPTPQPVSRSSRVPDSGRKQCSSPQRQKLPQRQKEEAQPSTVRRQRCRRSPTLSAWSYRDRGSIGIDDQSVVISKQYTTP